MPLQPDQVAELSRLLDDVLELDPARREAWLQELDRSRPEVARRLRGMLEQADSSDTALLPKLPAVDPDDAVAQTGERVGPYVLVREIGRGGMGSVWLADRADGAFKRRLALKLPRLTWSAGLAKRMARERDIGALLEHPNIARLYDAGVDEHGRPYIAMEYIDGQPIDDYCRAHAMDVRARLKLFLQVVQAVAYAHGRLVLHRDLKPSNVLVDANGQAHLLDFGIARLLDETTGSDLTQEQGRVLTLSYAAPEHIAGRPIGVTADVYALGVLLYELLTGTLPYTATRKTSGALEDAILAGDAPKPSGRASAARIARQLRGDLDAVIGKALKREPNERYQTAEALATDIQRYLDGQAIVARPDHVWYRLRKALARHRVPVTAVTTVIVVALVGLTTTLMQGRRAADEAERARLATAFVSELFRVNATQAAPMGNDSARAGTAAFVDRGAQLIEARFQGQPELQAELYGAVGRVYADLGVDRLATEYATRQLTALRAQNASAPRIARSLMLLSDAALTAERDADAEEYARQAVDTLPRNDAMLPDALALLARAQIRNGKFEEVERSVAEGKRLLDIQGKTHSLAGAWLTFAEGDLLRARNRFDDATPHFVAAISQAREVDGPQSSAASEMGLHFAQQLFGRNRSEEGRQYVHAALAALDATGDVGRIRAVRATAALQSLQYLTGVAGYYESMAVLDDVSGFLQSRTSLVPVEVMAEIDFFRARIDLEWGDCNRAKSLLASSAPVLLASKQSLFWQLRLAAFRGWCAMYLGEHEAADRFFREALDVNKRMGRIDQPSAVYEWTSLAINLSMQGHHREAEAVLLTAPPYAEIQGDPLADATRAIPQTLARVRLNAGDLRGAQQVLPPTTPPTENEDPAWAYYPLRGEIACASGRHEAGLSDLTRTLASRSTSSIYSPNNLWIARLRAVAGLCALSFGNRKQAEELAKEAQRAFVAQPNFSPYFREPLIRLEQKLRPNRAATS